MATAARQTRASRNGEAGAGPASRADVAVGGGTSRTAVEVAGATSRAAVEVARVTQRSSVAVGEPPSEGATLPGLAGSRSQQTASSAAVAHIPASTPYTAAKPACAASHGSNNAPRQPPNGTAVCRMLIARPRSPSSNQAITARPLAPLTLPPSMPTSNRPSPSSHKPGTSAPAGAAYRLIQANAAAVAPRPVSSTGRSPQRSVSNPHGSSNSATPSPIKPNAKPS